MLTLQWTFGRVLIRYDKKYPVPGLGINGKTRNNVILTKLEAQQMHVLNKTMSEEKMRPENKVKYKKKPKKYETTYHNHRISFEGCLLAAVLKEFSSSKIT